MRSDPRLIDFLEKFLLSRKSLSKLHFSSSTFKVTPLSDTPFMLASFRLSQPSPPFTVLHDRVGGKMVWSCSTYDNESFFPQTRRNFDDNKNHLLIGVGINCGSSTFTFVNENIFGCRDYKSPQCLHFSARKAEIPLSCFRRTT